MDQETGWKELMRQAESGDAEAQCRLGCKLDFGDDETECDKAAARKWYRRAAEQGNLTAMNNLGLMLKNGEGGSADLKAGLELLFRAAEAGDEYAQRNCGKACERGEIPGAGLAEAERWYRLAIAGGHREAIFDLGYLLSDLLPSPTAEQLAEAAQLYRKLADEGDCEACYNLAVHYDFGKGVPVNHWWRSNITGSPRLRDMTWRPTTSAAPMNTAAASGKTAEKRSPFTGAHLSWAITGPAAK